MQRGSTENKVSNNREWEGPDYQAIIHTLPNFAL